MRFKLLKLCAVFVKAPNYIISFDKDDALGSEKVKVLYAL